MGQSKMDYPEKLATIGTRRRQTKQIHNNICVGPLCANKHKKRKQDMSPPTNNWR